MLLIRRATLADLETMLAWRAEAIAWLAKRGIDQWTYPTDPPYPTRERAIETITAGQTWMVWDHSIPAATLTLTGYIDPELWDIVDDPENALYLHKLTVPRTRAGVGLGVELLDWAGGHAHNQGLGWLRLDAWTTNTQLQRYYLRQGFEHVHTVATRPSGACYQRPTRPYTGTRLKNRRLTCTFSCQCPERPRTRVFCGFRKPFVAGAGQSVIDANMRRFIA